jgi:hypothetical protein
MPIGARIATAACAGAPKAVMPGRGDQNPPRHGEGAAPDQAGDATDDPLHGPVAVRDGEQVGHAQDQKEERRREARKDVAGALVQVHATDDEAGEQTKRPDVGAGRRSDDEDDQQHDA